jgi:hypothetical protein
MDRYTRLINFSNAFVQAVLDEPVWIHLTREFNSSRTGTGRTFLRLRRRLYGLSVAPQLWYEHLFVFILEDGFKQSNDDKCLLIKKDMLVILHERRWWHSQNFENSSSSISTKTYRLHCARLHHAYDYYRERKIEDAIYVYAKRRMKMEGQGIGYKIKRLC